MSKIENVQQKRLTKSQLAIWAGQQMAPEVPLYNTIYAFDIESDIDINAFQLAFEKLVRGTDTLRTVFREEDSVPYQIVLPKIDHNIDFLDFSDDFDVSNLKKWIAHRSQKSLDLYECTFDTALIKLKEDRFIWFLNVHHIITDAISSTLIHRKVFEYYVRLRNRVQLEIVELPAFAEYLNYEEAQSSGEQNSSSREYWKKKTDSPSPLPKLYGKENKQLKTDSQRITLTLGIERSNKLKELSKSKAVRSLTPRLTVFNLFSTLIFSYLYRIGDQRKITVGATAHNRPTQQFQQTPGLFMEIFPLKMEIEDDDTFKSVLQKAKLETGDYLRYGQSGMTSAEISRSYNVILNYMTSKFDIIDGIPMKSRWIHPGHNDPAHVIRCHVYDFDAEGDLSIHFDLNKGVFDKESRDLAPKHFLRLLDALLEDIDQPIAQPNLISEKETATLLNRSSVSKEAEKKTIISKFEAQADKTPDKVALRFRNEKISYAQLNSRASQFCNHLKKKRLSKDDIISIHLERSSNYITSILGVLKLGATFVPISSDQPKERIEFILSDSGSKALITNTLNFQNIDTEKITIINLDDSAQYIDNEKDEIEVSDYSLDSVAYTIYTSGSTGKPKGVKISNASLTNYLNWSNKEYSHSDKFVFPLFTSVGFDLTITSTFLPLITGGELIIYSEGKSGPDISIMKVVQDNLVNSIKLTPSHLKLLQDEDLSQSNLKVMIVGGEDFKASLAHSIQESIGGNLKVYNEYGPTEATVGCIASKFVKSAHIDSSMPIGKPISNMTAYVLDKYQNLVPKGVSGELFLSGLGLANGYSDEILTEEKFLRNPFETKSKMYRTGDLARWNDSDELEYLGRIDEQVKLNGFRIELSDIESNMADHPEVENSAVVLLETKKEINKNEVVNCKECGLPSSYPNIDFDHNDVCHLCNSFKGYKEKTDKYFKTEQDLKKLLTSKKEAGRKYDCLSLLSGGKDSTYVLARLVDMGLNVLAFTMDNGYISEQAKQNVNRITEKLGVDHIYGETPHMNKIFVDSLHRHKNVCNGCFKTIYTLSTKVALEKNIPFIVTGLSRGQFFETRLTEELFWDEDADGTTIDDTILEARKLYHQEEDAVKQHLDTSMFALDSTFEKVQYVDFYRYSDVSLTEMLKFLKEKAAWIRPTDTGRSTNCLINQAGIHVHKKEKGYSNYSFPYSWDVRLGHKNRDEALEEINEHIEVAEVEKMLDEIGYNKSYDKDSDRKQLVGFYTSKNKIPSVDLKLHLAKRLPEYMLPVSYKHLETLPLTKNGKVDKKALKALSDVQLEMDAPYVAPTNEIEELVEGIWREVLQLEKIGIHDNFIALGGHSLAAIRVTARFNDELQTNFSLNKVFELPTISEYATFIEEQLTSLLQEQN